MDGYIGVGIVLLILGFGLAFIVIHFREQYKNLNKYRVCFKKGFKKCGLPLIKLKINGKLDYITNYLKYTINKLVKYFLILLLILQR